MKQAEVKLPKYGTVPEWVFYKHSSLTVWVRALYKHPGLGGQYGLQPKLHLIGQYCFSLATGQQPCWQ